MMGCPMTKLFAGVSATALICGTVFTSIAAAAASNVDKIALQKATADCRVQVKEYAQYHETSWYARHKMIKSCIKDALAKKSS
jgi:hypothetical protein